MDDDLVAVINWAKSWLVTFISQKQNNGNTDYIEKAIYRYMKEVSYYKHVGIIISTSISCTDIRNITVQATSALNGLTSYKYKLD